MGLKRMFRKQRGLCHYCELPMNWDPNSRARCTTEHLVPQAMGGTNRDSNKVAACFACNNARGTQPHDAFKEWVKANGRPDNAPRRTHKRAPIKVMVPLVSGSWNNKPSAKRAYVNEIDKHPIMADAFINAKKR